MLGAAGIAFASLHTRITTLPLVIWGGLLVASFALALFLAGSATEAELLLMEDDVFAPLAWLSAALLAGFGILAITWIFNKTDALPRHH
jgi:hypothetical protein